MLEYTAGVAVIRKWSKLLQIFSTNASMKYASIYEILFNNKSEIFKTYNLLSKIYSINK